MNSTNLLRQSSFILLAFIIVFAGVAPVQASWDDSTYHHYDEILPELIHLRDSLRAEGLNYIRIDTIGYSQQMNLPFWAIYISDDVDVTYPDRPPRPAVVFNGTLHAEEILGTEYIMWLCRKMMDRSRMVREWRRKVDTYLLPVTNPEGMRIVFSLDNTYRKNMRDNIGDGLFRYKVGWGGDSSGVDINRNFPIFWTHGTGLFVLGDNEFYDYYRGPAPASESETRALIDLVERVRPLYSLTIHSSRTGKVAEQVIYPWGWGKGSDMKRPPDYQFLDDMANEIALRCKRFGRPNSTYATVRVGHPRGDAETFYYYTYGSYAIRVEIGQKEEGMQPNSAGIYQIISDVTLGFEWMLNSAAGLSSDDHGDIVRSRLDIQVTDAATGDPLSARLKLDSRSMPVIPYRYTNPRDGMYYWMISQSLRDTLRVSKFGYEPFNLQVRGNREPSLINVQMTKLPRHNVNISAHYNGAPIAEPVYLKIANYDTTWSTAMQNGSIQLELPENNYTMTFYAGNKYMPRIVDIPVNDADSTWMWDIELTRANVLLAQTFDDANVIFTSDNQKNLARKDSLVRWDLATDVFHSPPRCLTDSRKGSSPILEDGWAAPYNAIEQSFDLSDAESAALVYYLNAALEPGHDSLWVEFSTGGALGSDPHTWEWTHVGKSHQDFTFMKWRDRELMKTLENRPWNAPPVNFMNYHDWERVVIIVPDEFLGQSNVHFRFHMSTDYFLQEDGVYIDDVYLLASGANLPQVQTGDLVPSEFAIEEIYPNPFNSALNVKVRISQQSDLDVSLYNVEGRMVVTGVQGAFKAGEHTFTIDAGGIPSGLYILRADSKLGAKFRKVMLLK